MTSSAFGRGVGVQVGFVGQDFSTTQNLLFQYQERKAMTRIGVLVESYHTRTWWYELLDLCRKLFLNALIVFIGNQSAGQVRTEADGGTPKEGMATVAEFGARLSGSGSSLCTAEHYMHEPPLRGHGGLRMPPKARTRRSWRAHLATPARRQWARDDTHACLRPHDRCPCGVGWEESCATNSASDSWQA